MKTTVYELGRNGLVKMDDSTGRGLPVGAVLHWGGNMGWSARDMCILEVDEAREGYQCFDVDEPEKNARLHFTEYHSIKRKDDPAVWHGQHMFLTGRVVDSGEVAKMRWSHNAQRNASEAYKDAKETERARLEAEGRKLWARLMPTGTTHVIVAERIHDDSDMMTDYHGEHTETTVILAASKHGRDNFAEMRKAALKIPETAHLGPGCEEYHIAKLAPKDDEYNRSYAGRLGDDTGRDWWPTQAEAQAVLDAALAADKAQNDAVPFVCYCPRVPDGALITYDRIEHREKYSMGKGYYLQASSSNSWRVSKTRATGARWNEVTMRHEPTSEPDAGICVALAQRWEHLSK